jgi:hypothetical protein
VHSEITQKVLTPPRSPFEVILNRSTLQAEFLEDNDAVSAAVSGLLRGGMLFAELRGLRADTVGIADVKMTREGVFMCRFTEPNEALALQ